MKNVINSVLSALFWMSPINIFTNIHAATIIYRSW